MNENLALYSETITIGYSDCDSSGRAKITLLASQLQNIAMRHDLLISKQLFNNNEIEHLFAILRTNISISKIPLWKESVTVETWLHPLGNENRFLYRSFVYYDSLGEEIGHCTITAFPIDLVERKAVEIPESVKTIPTLDREISTLENSRIKRAKSIAVQEEATVLPSDIDMYNHVNNSRYLFWAVDYTPRTIQKSHYCISAEIQFRMELQEGQEFICKTEMSEVDDYLVGTHQIVRLSDSKEISRMLTRWKKGNLSDVVP